MTRKQAIQIRLLLWVLLIFILCSIPVPKVNTPNLIPHFDKIVHWGLFFFLGTFLYACLREVIRFPVILTLLCIAFYGALIEWLQETYFSRTADLWDWVADSEKKILKEFPHLQNLHNHFRKQ